MKDEFPRTEEGRRANLAVGTTEQRHRGGKAQDMLGKEQVNLTVESGTRSVAVGDKARKAVGIRWWVA